MKRSGLTLLELLVVLAILIALATLVTPIISNLGRKSQQISTRENLLRLQELILNRYIPDMGELPRPSTTEITAGNRINHPQLRYLFVNPDTEDIAKTANATILSSRHWQGPYLTHGGARYTITGNFTTTYGVGDVIDSNNTYTAHGDPTVLDAWGRPIVIQEPTGNVTIPINGTNQTVAGSTCARLVSAGPNGVLDTNRTIGMPTTTDRGDDIIMFLYRHDLYSDIDDYLSLEN